MPHLMHLSNLMPPLPILLFSPSMGTELTLRSRLLTLGPRRTVGL